MNKNKLCKKTGEMFGAFILFFDCMKIIYLYFQNSQVNRKNSKNHL